MGLRGTADVLAAIGMKDEAARLAAEADDYKACILDLGRPVDRCEDQAAVCSPDAVSPGSAQSRFLQRQLVCDLQPDLHGRSRTVGRPRREDRRNRLLARKARHGQRPAAARGRRDRSLLRLQPVAHATAARRAGKVRLDALQPLGLRNGAGNVRDDRRPQPGHRLQRRKLGSEPAAAHALEQPIHRHGADRPVAGGGRRRCISWPARPADGWPTGKRSR